ncbi:Flp family type IVb pilin [Hyphococcus flavus]|uniref:Flp family type IVb pilin n=1 Tax=Hyphococcus flavus TaxID=1866326 RepID=A0AAF0CIT5_9PROT|nr:Flp family type IVb pilin [Hyphococcus flavus]WDI33192.1 Flp family type IVb pilin [Hyphococcus flavus]
MKALIKRFKADEDGATAIEYGLIAALIAVAIIAAVRAVGGTLSTTFGDINTELSSE